MKTIRPVTHALFTGTAAIALMAQPAAAQSAAEETAQAANQPEDESDEDVIIVTATKRASTVQDVPFSIDAQSQKDIERANAQTVEDLSRNVAGLTVQNLGPGQSQVSVRGVSAGQIVRDQPGVKEQVGIYLDESVISLSLFTPDIDLYDLNRVETLRGPQGTLFGSGSVGGTLRYITNQPEMGVNEGSFEANANQVDGGGFGGHVKGMANIAISDNLALRAVGYYQRFPGFIDAFGPAGGDNINDGVRSGGRIALTYEPTDTVRLTPRIVFQNISTDGFNRQEFYNLYGNAFTDPAVNFGEREQYLLLREGFEDDFTLGDLTASFEFGSVELTSVTSYTNRDILVSRDASALTGSVSVDLGFPEDAVNLPSNLRDTTDVKQWTQELRLASTGDGPLQWVIGGFYSDTDRVYKQRLPTPGYDAFVDDAFGAGTSDAVSNDLAPSDSPYAADIPYDIKQSAVFGEASYQFDRFTITAGARYYDFEETRDFISGGLFSNGDTNIGDKSESDGISPRFIVSYDATADLTVNAQISKGFRLGGTNDPLNLGLCDGGAPDGPDRRTYGGFPSYEDETLWNYEAGVKYSRSGITFNAAAFYTDISNLQVTADAGSCSSRVVFNAPEAHTMGIEAELSASPIEGLDLSLAGSIIEAQFDADLLTDEGDIIAGIRDGNRLPTVPEFQMAASATYATPISSSADLVFTTTLQHVGSRFTQPGDQEDNPRTFAHGLPFNGQDGDETTTVDLKLPSYQLLDISAGLEFDHGLDLIFYVKNVLDENALLSFDRERGGRARLAYTVGNPRTYGITLRKDF